MKSILVVVGAVLLAALAGCQSAQSAGGATQDLTLEQLDSIGRAYEPQIGTYGGTLRLPLGSDPDGFSPATAQSAYSSTIMSNIYQGLITVDPVTLEYIPQVAKSWDVSDDGLVWTFHMRDDVLFSDSVKVTAHDVEFTFNDVIYNEKVRSALNYNFRIDGKKIDVVALDSFTVQFTLPAPFAPFLTVAGMDIMPRHAYAEHARKGTIDAYLSAGAKPEHVVGSGPFILEKVELGQRIILRRNPLYWKEDEAGNRLPYLDRIIYHIIKEPNVAMLKFKSGEIDHLSLQGEHYPILKPLERERGYRLYKVGPSWYESFFVFNQNNQKDKSGRYFLEEKKQRWFRNKEFRQACAYAVNYDAIIRIVYNGLANPPAGIWGEHKGFFHSPDARTYGYDTTRARELLKANGFIDRDGDGFVEDKQGNPVEFTLTTSAGVQLIQQLYELVRKDLEHIGLKVHLNFIEFNNLIDKTSNTFDWDVVAYALGGIIDPHFGKSSVTSTSFRYVINPQRKRADGTLIAKKDRPWELRINRIFEEAVSEMDQQKRKALYDEWQEITQEQCLKVYMPLKEIILGVNDRFGNIHLTRYLALGSDLLHNIDEIYVKDN